MAQQAGTVFQATAKCALSGVRRQQFAVQVAVAALDIYAVKACSLGQFCRLGKLFFQCKQVLIGQDTVGRDRIVALKNGVIVRDERCGCTLRLGVAARMGGLHDDDGLKTVFTDAGFLDVSDKLLEICQVFLVNPQLTRIGASLGNNRNRFCPDQTCAALCESVISAQRQCIRTSVRRAVAALHRLNGNRVCCRLAADLYRTLQHVQILGQRQGHFQFL